ncbi:cell wall protein PRY3 [Tetranychus urticae]|uniref:SCP domain-containing protein n=1 Tax=Tetranychus urticae TaxID=32264 RepID=T1JSY9_TETUR|nr:cell wall protein PRY3 [Tetranychus urticae]
MKVITILISLLIVLPINCKTFGKYSFLHGKPKSNPIVETTNDQLIKDLLLYHKVIRDFHGLGPLEYSETLKEYARLKAMLVAFHDGSSHAIGEKLHLGENIWFEPTETQTSAKTVINGWYYTQLNNWNYSDPKVLPENRNFAQIVWKTTTQLGCGQAYSARTKPGTYTVCYYFPAGLTPSQESINVPPPTSLSPSSSLLSSSTSPTINPQNLETLIEGMVNDLNQN